ncbi:unnamed protein product, partial [Closterium sp. Naga37s-1]
MSGARTHYTCPLSFVQLEADRVLLLSACSPSRGATVSYSSSRFQTPPHSPVVPQFASRPYLCTPATHRPLLFLSPPPTPSPSPPLSLPHPPFSPSPLRPSMSSPSLFPQSPTSPAAYRRSRVLFGDDFRRHLPLFGDDFRHSCPSARSLLNVLFLLSSLHPFAPVLPSLAIPPSLLTSPPPYSLSLSLSLSPASLLLASLPPVTLPPASLPPAPLPPASLPPASLPPASLPPVSLSTPPPPLPVDSIFFPLLPTPFAPSLRVQKIVYVGGSSDRLVSPWGFAMKDWKAPKVLPGDSLVFQWSGEVHSVHKVSAAEYAACTFVKAKQLARNRNYGSYWYKVNWREFGKTLYFSSKANKDCSLGIK